MGKKKLLESRCSPSYIHDMMSTLSKNNSMEKLAKIDLIGFGFLSLVPNWSVKITHEHVVRDPFPALDESNPSHVTIKNRFYRRSTTELRDLVYSCPMTTESDRMEFRRYFILVVIKMFLCPTTQQILYFQRLQYDVLDNCLEHEPWLDAWISERLEKKAQYILSEGRLLTRLGEGDDIKGRSPQAARKKPGKKEPQKRRNGEQVEVLEMLYLLNLCFPTVFFFKHARLLPWQAVCRVSPLSMATSHPLSENVLRALSQHG
ncbi:hypothetical protein AHAS_Ahas02G0062400 [Arachis hypogaea]